MSTLHKIAGIIHDAFSGEALLRGSKPADEWIAAELNAVLTAANDYAQINGMRKLTIEEVERCEISASGHTDYGKKWALCVASLLIEK